MQQGLFRQDLFFRLNVIELAVPALKDRPQDVLPLAERSLRQLASPPGPGRRFSEDARQALLAHDWPGNVRELMNRVQRATLVAGAGELTPEDLGLVPGAGRAEPPVLDHGQGANDRRRIEQILLETGGSVSLAAERLGLSRQALYRRMEKLGISLERRPRS
jgi:DNA-binding NtrC family response regulator